MNRCDVKPGVRFRSIWSDGPFEIERIEERVDGSIYVVTKCGRSYFPNQCIITKDPLPLYPIPLPGYWDVFPPEKKASGVYGVMEEMRDALAGIGFRTK